MSPLFSRRWHAAALWMPLVLALMIGCWSSGALVVEYETAFRCPDCPELSVDRVIDGDTLDTNAGRVRLFGVDTPERGEKCSSQATASLGRLAGRTVKVEVGPRLRDPNGRLLYYVYTESGNSVDEILIREGLALAWARDGQYRDFLVRLENEARTARTGCLWLRSD